jgi:hypothetical protein
MSKRKKRAREMKALMIRLLCLVTDEMLKSFGADRADWGDSINRITKRRDWVDFYPFGLTAVRGGWELSDGDPDPYCNGMGNTFTEAFPHDVEPQKLLDRMLQSINEGLITNHEQFMEYLHGNSDSILQSVLDGEGI